MLSAKDELKPGDLIKAGDTRSNAPVASWNPLTEETYYHDPEDLFVILWRATSYETLSHGLISGCYLALSNAGKVCYLRTPDWVEIVSES